MVASLGLPEFISRSRTKTAKKREKSERGEAGPVCPIGPAARSRVHKTDEQRGRSQNVYAIGRERLIFIMFGRRHHHQLPRLCWLKGSTDGANQAPDEQSWIIKHTHVAIGSKTPINLTIGNKKYALSGVAESAGADSKTKYPSEAALYKKYS